MACCLAWLLSSCSSRPAADIRTTTNAHGQIEEMLFLGRHVRDADLKQLGSQPHLKVLALQECSQLTDAGLAAISEARGLTKLSLIRVGISDEGLAPLAALSGLTDLELANTQVHGAGLKYLANLPLERLVLTSRVVTVEGLASLGSLKSQRQLEMDCQDLQLKDLTALSQLTQLETLMALATPAGNSLELLRGMPLKKLHLSAEQIEDESIDLLNSLASLRDVRLTGGQTTDEGLRGLRLPELRYRRPASIRSHIGLGPSFVEKDKLFNEPASLTKLPILPFLLDVRTLLFGSY